MACHLCEKTIEGQRIDLLCSHSFHTLCFLGLGPDNQLCTCGRDVFPARIAEEFRIKERAKEEAENEKVAAELNANAEFKKDLRELRSCLSSVRKTRAALFSFCREERRTFIAETKPFVETILQLQKESVKRIRAKEEYKALRRAQTKAQKKMRFIDVTYPGFNRRHTFLRMFHLPSQWNLRYSLRSPNWRIKRFFRVSSRLF